MAGRLRVLDGRDAPAILALLDEDPVETCFVASRVRSGMDPWRLGGEVWGFEHRGRLLSVLYAGANLVPVRSTPESRAAFAERARRTGRRSSSLVGPAEEVLDLWAHLEPAWGPAREVRACQPLLAIDHEAPVPADPLVRRVVESELDALLPACIAMFTEEVGVSPLMGGAGPAYRSRILEIVRDGRAFARFDDSGAVVFKAEVGAATPQACQIQGVWVDPARRGEGLSSPGMAAVVDLARTLIAPVVSLYVNDYNEPARRAYARTGFQQVGTLATVLF